VAGAHVVLHHTARLHPPIPFLFTTNLYGGTASSLKRHYIVPNHTASGDPPRSVTKHRSLVVVSTTVGGQHILLYRTARQHGFQIPKYVPTPSVLHHTAAGFPHSKIRCIIFRNITTALQYHATTYKHYVRFLLHALQTVLQRHATARKLYVTYRVSAFFHRRSIALSRHRSRGLRQSPSSMLYPLRQPEPSLSRDLHQSEHSQMASNQSSSLPALRCSVSVMLLHPDPTDLATYNSLAPFLANMRHLILKFRPLGSIVVVT
jgi:hypothetical protein